MKPFFRKWVSGWLLWGFLILLMGGCASPRPAAWQAPAVEEEARPLKGGWWYARFRIAWPEKAEPSWYMDLLLADRIISPILEKHKNDIHLWRFHRRAARDEAGHQFNFIFFALPETAAQIYDELGSDPLLKELEERGLIVRTLFDDTTRVLRPDIGDTSDGHWSPEIRRSWPYFIMGVSETWLELIKELTGPGSDMHGDLSFEETLKLYREVNEKVTEMWRREGGHAFLHHLNALFGYEYINIPSADIFMRF